MELFIKESKPDYLEVIDVENPQYIFVLEGIEFKEVSGQLEVVVNRMSVVKSKKQNPADYRTVEEEDQFLEKHMQKIVTELFDSITKTNLK